MKAACRFLGHRLVFAADGPVLHWHCARGCGAAGHKRYADPGRVQRYATAFNHRDADDLGRRAPLIGLLPLRLWRKSRSRRHQQGSLMRPQSP